MPHDIHLDVPFMTQMKVGAHSGGNYFNDSTGCRYSAVCMLGYLFEKGIDTKKFLSDAGRWKRDENTSALTNRKP